jgi:hypothetical protein
VFSCFNYTLSAAKSQATVLFQQEIYVTRRVTSSDFTAKIRAGDNTPALLCI